jgi:hypothetical protein
MSDQNPLELPLNQKFEKERFARVIDESSNIEELRKVSKVLLDGWFAQRAATQWMLRQALSAPVKTTNI